MDYRREIDGLRALAVLPVILFHAGFQTFSGGFVGVDVFFVISGFLITGIIIAETKAGSFSLMKFYERRARRILPALFFVLAACLPWAWFWLLPSELKRFSESLAAISVFASNIFFSRTGGYFETTLELEPLLHTWSLAVEEQYYLLFPLLLMLTWRLGNRKLLLLLAGLAVASLALAHWGAFNRPRASFYLLPTRAWELLLGGFMAFHFARRGRPTPRPEVGEVTGMAGIVLIVYAILAFDKQTPFPSLHALVPTLGAALVIAFATPRTLAGKLLGSRALVGIGLISYSAYLWHQPLFAFAKYRAIGQPEPLLLAGLAAAALGLAYFSWKHVETPFRNKASFGRRRIAVLCLVGSTLFLAIGLAGKLMDGYPGRVPGPVRDILASAEAHDRQRDDGGCNVVGDGHLLLNCTKGDRSKSPDYLIVGDSHASALVNELDLAFGRAGISFRQYTKNGCPLASGLQQRPNEHCDKYQDAFLEDLAKTGISTLIVSSRWAYYASDAAYDNGEGGVDARGKERFSMPGVDFDRGLDERRAAILQAYRQSVQRLLGAGKRIILVYPIPEQGWHIPNTSAKRLWFGSHEPQELSVRSSQFRQRNAEVFALFDGLGDHPKLVRVRPDRIFCDTSIAGRCAARSGKVLFYYDASHLANAGAGLVVDEIMTHVRPSMMPGKH